MLPWLLSRVCDVDVLRTAWTCAKGNRLYPGIPGSIALHARPARVLILPSPRKLVALRLLL